MILIGVMVLVVAAIYLWPSSRESGSSLGESVDGTRAADGAGVDQSDSFGDGEVTPADEANPTESGSDPETNNSFRLGWELQENRTAGFSFRYPDRWTAKARGVVSKLTSPDRRVVVWFGLGPRRDFPAAYDQFIGLLHKSYGEVVVNKVDAKNVGDNSIAITVRGSASGDAGRVRYIATVLGRPNHQRAIGALATTVVPSGRFPSVVRAVLASLRPI
jgi:hypothetical protein